MKVTTERLEGSRVGFDMEFEPDEVSKAMDKVYRRIVNKVNVPGFRPGKAPRYMVERVVGRETMLEDAISEILPDAMKQALDDNKDLDLIGEPESEIKSVDPLVVRVTMATMPQIELPTDYRSIRVPAEPVSVSEDDVARVLHQAQSQLAKWNFPDPERPAKLGDRVHVDVQGYTADGPLYRTVQKEVFDLLSDEEGNNLLPALRDGLIGMNVGEEKDVATTLPEDYAEERLRGADVTFHVKLIEVQEGERPSLDEVAQQEGLADEAALRQRVRERLTTQREERSRSQQVDAIIRELADRVDVELPHVLIQDGIQRRVEELEERLSQQKLKLNQYLGYIGKTRADLEAEMREEVARDTKTSLLIEQLAEREGIMVSDEEVRQEAERRIETAIKQTVEQQTAAFTTEAETDDADDMELAEPASAEEVTTEDEAEAEATATEGESEDVTAMMERMVREQLGPMAQNEDYLDNVRREMLNHRIEDRLVAIASGDQLPEPNASEPAGAGEIALTPAALAEQQQTAGAGEFAGAQEAPAEADSPALNPINAPTSAQTDRADEMNDL